MYVIILLIVKEINYHILYLTIEKTEHDRKRTINNALSTFEPWCDILKHDEYKKKIDFSLNISSLCNELLYSDIR